MVSGPQKSAIIMAPNKSVTLIKDHRLNYPAICREVYIPDSHVRPEFAEMFARSGCQWASSLATSDLVVFTGGPDVNPKLYGEKLHKKTHFDIKRDDRDMQLYADALKLGVPMIGICRGAQFLWVMNGGGLYQDVDGHVGKHPIRDAIAHETIDNVSSTHHQMCRDDINNSNILAVAWEASKRWRNPKECDVHVGQDIEAWWIANTCCIGFQGHPEFANYSKYTQWVLEQIDHYICSNPRVRSDGQHYRHEKIIEIVEEKK